MKSGVQADHEERTTSFSLRNDFTPGMQKRYGTRSRKECTRRDTIFAIIKLDF